MRLALCSNVSLWLKYVEMEMRHRFINHARNIWDRAGALVILQLHVFIVAQLHSLS